MFTQLTLNGRTVIEFKIEQTISIIENILEKKSPKTPLFVMFSGGNDSLLLLDLVRKVTDDFLCCYMCSGIEFPEVLNYNQKYCDRLGIELCISYPDDYKGGFFDRIQKFKRFPTIRKTWCSRDLKVRPLNTVLRKRYGRRVKFFKLNGVRKYESTRRIGIHKDTPKKGFIIPDYDVSSSYMVFPILLWYDEERNQYFEMEKIKPPTKKLYDNYGVSGCYWCPFYQSFIYENILDVFPNLYDEFIEWEIKINTPCVQGHVWLKDLKEKVINSQRL